MYVTDSDGKPVEPIALMCEYPGCNKKATVDCKRAFRVLDPWNREPEALCEEHSRGREVIRRLTTEEKSRSKEKLMTDELKLADKIEYLRLVAELEGGPEIGDRLKSIVGMHEHVEHIAYTQDVSPGMQEDKLIAAYVATVEDTYAWITKHFKVVETAHTAAIKQYDLEFLDVEDNK